MSPPTPGTPPRRLPRLARNAAGALVLLIAFAALLPPLAGFDPHLVEGGSMSPSIPHGSVVFERRVPMSELKKNDVITFTRPEASGPVTRRIVSFARDRFGRRVFWTKSDAAARPDPRPVHFESAQQPRMSFHVPYVGWPLIALGGTELGLLLLGLLALGIAAVTLVSAGRAAPPPRARQRPAARRAHGVPSA